MLKYEEIAARTGFSTNVISCVINGSPPVEVRLRRRILRAIAELGYNVTSIVEHSTMHCSHTHDYAASRG